MADIIAKLRAALDGDEWAIRAYLAHRQHPDECDSIDDYDSCSIHAATAAACRYRDMDFGRRQVAAMRKVLDEYEQVLSSSSALRKAGQPDMALGGAVLALHGVVKRFAEAYGIEP